MPSARLAPPTADLDQPSGDRRGARRGHRRRLPPPRRALGRGASRSGSAVAIVLGGGRCTRRPMRAGRSAAELRPGARVRVGARAARQPRPAVMERRSAPRSGWPVPVVRRAGVRLAAARIGDFAAAIVAVAVGVVRRSDRPPRRSRPRRPPAEGGERSRALGVGTALALPPPRRLRKSPPLRRSGVRPGYLASCGPGTWRWPSPTSP